MVLALKRWKSRTSPGIAAGVYGNKPIHKSEGLEPSLEGPCGPLCVSSEANGAAGWSSPVARQAHNLKVVGSNPTPATTISNHKGPPVSRSAGLCASGVPDPRGRVVERARSPFQWKGRASSSMGRPLLEVMWLTFRPLAPNSLFSLP